MKFFCININKNEPEHLTYICICIFHRIFLSNYWWQESNILSQASYRYAILWEAVLDPSDSYFLGTQEVGIWRVKKRFPQYGIPIWCLWPNIRFLPSTVTEKNATKNILDAHFSQHLLMTEIWYLVTSVI
jgi:hypothetical protein